MSSYHQPKDHEKIDLQVKRIMKIERDRGIPQQYFVGATGIVRVSFGGKWWDYDKLAQELPLYQGWDHV